MRSTPGIHRQWSSQRMLGNSAGSHLLGSFRFTHVDVMIMPNMSGEALLGMNVLRNFRIEQTDKVLLISTP